MTTFGENVRKRRLELGLGLREMGRGAEMAPTTIGQIERDEARPYLDTALLIAHFLDTDIYTLLGNKYSVNVTIDKPRKKRKLKK